MTKLGPEVDDSIQYSLRLIGQDDAGVEFYLQHYVPFRLRALHTDPRAFGSTFAQESAFPEDMWRNRVLTPQARTWVAVRRDKQIMILSSLTLRGPFLGGPAAGGDASLVSGDAAGATTWKITGVWTAPESRRRGISKALLAEATAHALEHSLPLGGGRVMLELEVVVGNDVARAFYERVGFTPVGTVRDGKVQLARYFLDSIALPAIEVAE